MTKVGVLIGISHGQTGEQDILVGSLLLLERGQETQQVVLGGNLAIGDDGQHIVLSLYTYAFYQGHKLCLFGCNVVMEGSPGNLEIVQCHPGASPAHSL